MSHEILRQDLAELAAELPAAPRLEPGDAAALATGLAFAPAELPDGAWEELESKLVSEDEAPRVSLSCTYCHDGLSTSGAQAVAYCASCLAPHHLDCFEEHARCSAPGCSETRWVQPQSSGQAPPPVVAAQGKPELRVLASESAPAAPRRGRRWTTIAGVLAASLLGVSVAALSLFDATPDARMSTSSGRGTFLVFARTLPAGTRLTPDDAEKKEYHPSEIKVLTGGENSVITESRLAEFLGRRLDRRVLAGELIQFGQFRAPDQLPVGATLETYVFTHDVQPGEALSEGDFERREVAWKMLWEAPDQGLVPETQVQAYLGRRLTSRGKGGEPIRLSHFASNPLLNESWNPTPAERSLALSEQGRRLIRLARPVERARAYVIHHLRVGEVVDLDAVEIASYCPPQPTLYAWLVTFPNTGGEAIYVAVTEAGRTWEVDAARGFAPVRPEEFQRGGLLPDEAKRPRKSGQR